MAWPTHREALAGALLGAVATAIVQSSSAVTALTVALVDHDEVTVLVHQDDRLVAVSTQSGAEIPCDAAWIATRLKPASDLAASLCDVDDAGFAKVDEPGRTSRAGVFAIGNTTNPIAHLAHAAAAGTEVRPWITMHVLESLLLDRREG